MCWTVPVPNRLNQHPTKRYEDGVFVGWQARVRMPDGTRPGFGVHATKKDAQAVMDAEWDRWHGQQAHGSMTVGEYAKTWTEKHPRSRRTNEASNHRLSRVLDVRVEGVLFRDWPMRELKRRHINELVGAMLRVA